MSSDNQYTALGPAAVGFQTDGANIAKGAEVAGTQLGVHGTGPVGVLGQGQGGPGGQFTSDGNLDAQIHVQPHPMANPGVAVTVPAQEFAKISSLPVSGRAGDFYLGTFTITEPAGPPITRCALWLCVSSSGPQGRRRNGARSCWATRFLAAPQASSTPAPRLPLEARFSPALEHPGLPGRPFAVARQGAAAEPGEDLRDVLPEPGAGHGGERERHGRAVVPAEQRLDVRLGTRRLTAAGQGDRPEAGDEAFSPSATRTMPSSGSPAGRIWSCSRSRESPVS